MNSESDKIRVGAPEDILWQHHDNDVDLLLRKNLDFIVYIDKKLDVHWEDTKAYEEELAREKIDVGKIQGAITCLEAIPVDHLPEGTRRSFRAILGEAMCNALEKNLKGAQSLLTKGEEFVTARNHEHARTWYVSGSATAAIIALTCSPIVVWIYEFWHPNPPMAALNIVAVGIGGAVGALFSILLRVGRAPLDPAAGIRVHNLEGAARVMVGIIGALIVLCAIRADLLLPQLTSPYGIVLACVIAGASERLASAIVERVEGALSHSVDKQRDKTKSTKILGDH